MEVTNLNFTATLPEIEKTIKNATFLAIDCEFSGLNTLSEVNAFDTPKQYYEKIRKNCMDFLVLQYGISAFRYDKASNLFKQQTYNFYIFRRPVNRNIPDQRFLCQTSSVNFLIEQGFDFNKLFKFGISYLNTDEERVYREKIDERLKVRINSQQNSDIIPIPDNMQAFIDDTINQLDGFLSKNSSAEELELPKCNAFMRRLIYQTVGQKYANKIHLQTKSIRNDRVLVASHYKTAKDQEKLLKQQYEEEVATLDEFIGFTKVLKTVIDSGKLVVGHNMCLDFVHTIDKFLTCLPQDYQDFKELSHSLFKSIVDTKFMATSDKLNVNITSTILKDLLETVSKAPFEMPTVQIEENGQGYSLDEPKEHEAGFDAYITGLCFISMWKYLGEGKDDCFSDFKSIEPYVNKLYLMLLRDNVYINLSGADPTPSRDHVFHLTFPREWKLSNITELFSPFGGVYVSWLNETCAFVCLYKKDQAEIVLSTLSQSDTYSIMTYAQKQSLIDSNSEKQMKQQHLMNRRKRSVEFTPTKYPNKRVKIETTSSSANNFIECEADKNKSKTFAESDVWE